jgi:hypothetical protein
MALVLAVTVCSSAWAQTTVVTPNASSSIQQCGSYILYFTSTYNLPACVAELYKGGVYVTTYSGVYKDINNILSANGLSLGSDYQLKVYNPAKPQNAAWSSYFTVSPPAAPTATAATSMTTTSFVLNWNAVPEATDYRIDVAKGAAFGAYLPGYQDVLASSLPGSGTSRTIARSTPGMTLYYRVRTVIGACTSANSNVITVAPCIPPVPSEETEVKATSFVANWQAVSGATQYYLYVYTDLNSTVIHPNYNGIAVSGTSQLVNQNILANNDYTYKVSAYNGCTSDLSSAIIVYTACPRTSFWPLQTSSITNSSFHLVWNQPSGADQYLLDVSTSQNFLPGTMILDNYNTGSNFSRTINGLNPTTTYYCRVSVINWYGVVSDESDTQIVLTSPNAPLAREATRIAVSGSTMFFAANWDAVSGATGYWIHVYRRTGPNCTAVSVHQSGGPYTTSLLGIPNEGSEFFYKVKADNNNGSWSLWSNEISVVIGNHVPVLAVPPVSGITSSSFTVNWNAVPNALDYRLDVSTSSVFSSFVPGYNNLTVTGTSQVVNQNLTPGTTYHYRVRSRIPFTATCGTSSFGYSDNRSGSTATACSGCRLRSGDVTEEADLVASEFSTVIYPNPVSTVLHVPLKAGYDRQEVRMRIYQSNGGEVYAPVDWNSNGASVDVSSFTGGLYLVRVHHDGLTETQKFLKQ